MSFAERQENRKKALREILDNEAREREAETKRLTAPSAPAQRPDVQSLTEKFNSLQPKNPGDSLNDFYKSLGENPQKALQQYHEGRAPTRDSSKPSAVSPPAQPQTKIPAPADHSAPGTNFTVYDRWGNTYSKVLGATGTMRNMDIEAVEGNPEIAKVKSDDAPQGYIMPTYEARRLIQYMGVHHALDDDRYSQLWDKIKNIENGPIKVTPSQKLQDIVSSLGNENKNIVFDTGSKGDLALKQQSLMASPAMLDSLKNGGMKHLFLTSYPQLMQEYATNVWDAARSGDPQRLSESKKSFVSAMEHEFSSNPGLPREKPQLYQSTADMIGEAAKRGLQVHFTAILDPRTREQVEAEESRATGSPHERLRYDRESEFIRLTAQKERFAVITDEGQRHVTYDNSFEKQLKNTEHIYLTDKTPNPYLGFSRMDYYYAMDSQFMGGMKAPRDPPPPGASYRDTPAMGTP